MTDFNHFWHGLSGRARSGLLFGSLLIVALVIGMASWLLRTDYQVLFADLAPADAATFVSELDKLKTPYRISGNGTTILVPAGMVYPTRLKLVGKELPLRGAVGFELFNNSEIGMTEFAQRLTISGALQGELTRTIMSLEEVENVRVHLALPDRGLFKKAHAQAKASIALELKADQKLSGAQVQGIQRLVSAAVPEIRPEDVTLVDHRGIALTRQGATGDPETEASSGQLERKQEIEAYLVKKVTHILDRTFGTGQGIASVDVVLSHEHSKVTTDEALSASPEEASGVLKHERLTRRTNAGSGSEAEGDGDSAGISTREVDYQVGHRVEQTVSSAGAIRQINVAIVVQGSIDAAQLERVKDLVSAAVGADRERGDAVAVYTLDQLASGKPAVATPTDNSSTTRLVDTPPSAEVMSPQGNAAVVPPTPTGVSASTDRSGHLWLWGLGGLLALGCLLALGRRRPITPPPSTPLSLDERQRVLQQVRDWMSASSPAPQEQAGE